MIRMRTDRGLPVAYVRQSAAVCRALAHPARFKLAEILLAGEQTVGELVKLTSLPQNAVSQHLKELHTAKVISRTKRGRRVICRLTSALAANLLRTAQREYQLTRSYSGGEAI